VNKELIAADENNVERKISSLKLQIALGDVEGSFEIYQRALDEANESIRFEPKNENLIRLMKILHSRVGNSYRSRGNSEISKGNIEAARNWYLQALEHSYREVYYMEANPNVITDKHWIYNGYESHAENLSRLGRIEEAMENLEIAGKILQDLKRNNPDDREIELMEIAFLRIRQAVLKQHGKPEAALAVTETALNLALKRTEADPTNIEPISATLNLADAAANLASGLKKERQAESYRQICHKYEKQYKERFGGDFVCVF